jgi:formiminotetrahydrofolate cyclodeaminase
MVTNLTVGKKKYAAVHQEMVEAQAEATRLRATLSVLMRRDAQAFDRVLLAVRLPQATPEEAETRDSALLEATWEATRVPLETAEVAARAGALAAWMVARGNANAASDAASACAMARAAVESALYNVQINLQNLPDGADKEVVRERAHELARVSEQALVEARSAFAIATERTA